MTSQLEAGQPRVIVVDVCDESREVIARRLNAQGYSVEAAADPAGGADMALASPPTAVIADLWMPSISGVQLCRLLRAEPATADVPVILRGESDDPRSRFWAERAGATAYVKKGRMGELVRLLSKAVAESPGSDGFFMQLSGGSVDIRDRIARHLDSALFDSVIAAEVRSLGTCGSFERLFDLFAQFLSQVISYRWVALTTVLPDRFFVHHHPHAAEGAEQEARASLGLARNIPAMRVVDEDARSEPPGPPIVTSNVCFGNLQLGKLALAPCAGSESNTSALFELVARELGGPVRMAALVDEQQRLAAIDSLTGLRNRRSFLEQLQIEVARSTRYGLPLCVLLLDVDHFKTINDSHGHSGGDQVLSALGTLLRNQLRIPDISARWGGEEFVVALTNTDGEGGQLAAERLRRAIEQMLVPHGEARIPVTASVGLAALHRTDTLESLVDRADRAMYAAKMMGRNRLVVAEPAEGMVEKQDTASV